MKAKQKPNSGRPKSHNARPKKRNPSTTPKQGHRPRKRNPSGFASKGIGLLKSSIWAGVGLVLTRQLPQLLLKDKNSGAIGYLANIATALVVGAGVSRFGGGAEAGAAATVGGGLYLLNRVLNENASPVGKYLSMSGLGDAMALGEILTGDRTYFPTPVPLDNNRNPIIPSQIQSRPPAVAAMVPAAGMGMVRRRLVA